MQLSQAMGKSAAKIRRNQARAAARGEAYTLPPQKQTDESSCLIESEDVVQTKSAAAQKLETTLAQLEENPNDLNSKDRRTAKRKAEAIAAEEAGCTASELLEWHARFKKKRKAIVHTNSDKSTPVSQMSREEEAKFNSAKKLKEVLSKLEADDGVNAKERRSAKRKAEAIAAEETGCDSKELLEWHDALTNKESSENKSKRTPYIVFVGQMAYSTTSDMLFQHFQTTLGSEVISKETTKIRLLTDPKTKKSKGMAFVELSTPEALYECLKMHLTHLDGRRINVERSSGGGVAAKKSKISIYRERQSTFISETMDKIISYYVKNGDIEKDELDEGVIALCKRHSATVVEQALKEYVEEKKTRKERKEKLGEKEEEELRNPSAFLTHMIGRVAEEGMADAGQSSKKSKGGHSSNSRSRGPSSERNDDKGDSILEKEGVDMSTSHAKGREGNNKIASIFPSMQRGRGRGRGRGYM